MVSHATHTPYRQAATKHGRAWKGRDSGLLVFLLLLLSGTHPVTHAWAQQAPSADPAVWIGRAKLVESLFRRVYSNGWMGANGAIGNARLFQATGDTAIRNFHLHERPITNALNGTWVDDRAWVCLAELLWWDVTGRVHTGLVEDARQRYDMARGQGRLSKHEGYWTWYNYGRQMLRQERVFTNSNMNQMVSVACRLYEATGDTRYLQDALLVWHGDSTTPGIVQTLYRGGGVWSGQPGLAAFGKELPWHGAEYCSIGAELWRVTHDDSIRAIVIATARFITDPATGWLDPVDWYQIHMDGNGAFVNFLIDAWLIAPDELAGIPGKIGRMLEHVWTNHGGRAEVELHREADHGIRNGWNPRGGEDGYGVDQVGSAHAQSQALRAFGTYAWILSGK